MQILDVQPIDTDTLGALMRHVVTTSLSLEKLGAHCGALLPIARFRDE
ncbi:hypothetical protein [Trinickia diaoshuihuensis]|nr:hypothetical protein [Trinickia diaoshuihuensis]